MKPSHFQTPRSLCESTFWHGGEAIEWPEKRRAASLGWWIAAVSFAVLCLSLIAGAKA